MQSDSLGELDYIWKMVYEDMHNNSSLSEVAFKLWFDSMKLVAIDSNTATFTCDSATKQDILQKRYSELIGNSLERTIGFRPNIKITVAESDGSSSEKAPSEPVETKTSEPEQKTEMPAAKQPESTKSSEVQTPDVPEPEIKKAPEKPAPTAVRYPLPETARDYTFDNFYVGDSNNLASAASHRVADQLGVVYNPLFIYGNSGLGKTHLMYAIANRALEKDPMCNVIFIKGEEFTNELVNAIQSSNPEINRRFREKYRSCDILLIDDIQFIVGKESTEQEFFNTFDALKKSNKQIVVTSDKPPKEMHGLAERIKSRFESGLVVDIQPPAYELRYVILTSKAKQYGVEIPPDVLDFLAQNIKSSVRQIEGVVQKLQAKNSLSGMQITMSTVSEMIPEYLREKESDDSLAKRIIETVSGKLNVSVADVLGASRRQKIQEARNVSMYLIRDMTSLSLAQIGSKFNRDHSTVHSNITAIDTKIKADSSYITFLNDIRKEVRTSD